MIVQHSGLWWPESDQNARWVITRDCDPSIKQLLQHVRGRDCIIQAGANVGVYPLALADHFQAVVTVEPDPENFACLTRNLQARDSLSRVEFQQAALGDKPGHCRMVEVSPANCGANRIDPGGSIPVITIDDLAVDACDAIWLDIEGFELPALKGAMETIEQFSPIIAVEDKGLQVAYGIAPGELQNWLGRIGYHQIDRIGQDKVFKRIS